MRKVLMYYDYDDDDDYDDKVVDDSDDDGKDDGTRTRVNKAPLMSALNLYQISL